MENEDIHQGILENTTSVNPLKIFKLDYKGQNINNNNKFINWKKKMDVEYGDTD